MNKPKLSPTQHTLLAKLCALEGVISRWHGGFWVPDGVPPVRQDDQGYSIPAYYVGLGTVRAMEKLGLLEVFHRNNCPVFAQPRRLTEKARIMHCIQEETVARSRQGSASSGMTRAVKSRSQREDANPPGSQIIDLMAALKASLARR